MASADVRPPPIPQFRGCGAVRARWILYSRAGLNPFPYLGILSIGIVVAQLTDDALESPHDE